MIPPIGEEGSPFLTNLTFPCSFHQRSFRSVPRDYGPGLAIRFKDAGRRAPAGRKRYFRAWKDPLIHRRYASLVRKGTKLRDVSGMDNRSGLFRGLEIDVESLRSLVAGGIAFATPDDPGDEPAKGGAAFPLHDKPKKEWLEWAPKIRIHSGAAFRDFSSCLSPKRERAEGARISRRWPGRYP